MNFCFTKLSTRDLESLAAALRSGRLPAPFNPTMVRQYVSTAQAEETVAALSGLHEEGFSPPQIARLIEASHAERSARMRPDEIIDLVTSGPDAPGATNRDTGVVVSQLFSKARQSVLVAGYAVYQGDRVFSALADRMRANESLDVKFYLDIRRRDKDTTESSILVWRFMQRLLNEQWPEDCRLPEVYYDPRSLHLNKRSSLHAKCIVVDKEIAFVSSANFTNAGQERNIEVGTLLRTPIIARQLASHFEKLRERGFLLRADPPRS
ncbi:Phospholipase D Active site motif protein [Planctomycetes bacterium CA13]|uniref:Phospholipase D Active site motif protein n=1 Tax=Novipirellula herctigrandis TaxID=2527986 RepID=A0A5C5Z0F0_9BACT|nr:Phospholipase D Active site motif protein [Planctomycetes bacterium CA13]